MFPQSKADLQAALARVEGETILAVYRMDDSVLDQGLVTNGEAPVEKRLFLEVLSPSEIKAYTPPPGIVLVGDNQSSAAQSSWSVAPRASARAEARLL